MLFDNCLQEITQIERSLRKRGQYLHFRQKHFLVAPSFIKVAFDTRRIDQNLEFNPRRNLQYYQRSEPYVSNQTADKVQTFFKVKIAADKIREEFVGEPDWLDSYTRILCNALDQVLRVAQKDFDYSTSQLDYLQELLYVRYRLRPEDIVSYSNDELKNIIMNKDERLVRRAIFVNYKRDLEKTGKPEIAHSSDPLIEKLFGDVKASKDNKSVERSVNIIIKDRIVDDLTKES